MFGSEKLQTTDFQADYARRVDFCSVFEKDMDSLYKLAFLLTANHEGAERCFVEILNESFEQTRVFKDWAQNWVRRSLIRAAIRTVSPASGSYAKRELWGQTQDTSAWGREIDAVTRLAPLERFVFVMSVLERYSAWDCSLLLGVSTKKVASAQVRALRHLPARLMHLVGTETRPSQRLPVPA